MRFFAKSSKNLFRLSDLNKSYLVTDIETRREESVALIRNDGSVQEEINNAN